MNRALTEQAEQTELIVYLIDDDQAVLDSQIELLTATGFRVDAYQSADSFLEAMTPEAAGCVVTDLKMSGMSGLVLQHALAERQSLLPLIVVSGHANVPTAVELMENGAVTLLQKPYVAGQLLDAVQRGLDQYRENRDRETELDSIRKRLSSLSPGEKEVLKLMIIGRPNKVISQELEISMRTVDRRRSIVLEKMRVKSAPELARLVAIVGK